MKPNRIYQGDCLELMKTMENNLIDSIATDPPYGISFMGKKWDYQVPKIEVWKEVLRVLKPGGHLLSFGGTRTYHRMACAIEDAGFEIRDQIQWLYGSGFPKSLNIGKKIKGWEGWGTALKPANEPIVLARKPLSEKTVASNVLKWGTGGINVDGCRVEAKPRKTGTKPTSDKATGSGNTLQGSSKNRQAEYDKQSLGRFPANLIHDGSDEVVRGFPDTKSGKRVIGGTPRKTEGHIAVGSPDRGNSVMNIGDSGSASRFFYCAKASKAERNEGLEGFTNDHPTVKPVSLMRYLCKLITPPNGTVLDPFAGSGTTCIAAKLEGFNYIGIELDKNYCKISKARIKAWNYQASLIS